MKNKGRITTGNVNSEDRMMYVYILKCADGTLYTGYTSNMERRLKEHRAGNGARYTRTRTPVKLVYFESHETRRLAMQREASIKTFTRAKKLMLIKDGWPNLRVARTNARYGKNKH